MTRDWTSAKKRSDRIYGRAYTDASNRRLPNEKSVIDIYRNDAASDAPLLVFEHIRKTAGSSLKHVLHSNLASTHEVELLPCPETQAWFEEFWNTAVDRDRIAAIAGHSASMIVRNTDRPTNLISMVREPVDRVVSYYYFGNRPRGRIEDAFSVDDAAPGAEGARRASLFQNGQARALLAPWVDDVELIPKSANDPLAERWRSELHGIASRYTFGVQDRFAESIGKFASMFGWSVSYEATVKVNRDRTPVESIPAPTRDLILERNWLDAELYAIALSQLG